MVKALVSKSRVQRIEYLAAQKIFQFSQKSWISGKYDNGYIKGTINGLTLQGWAEGKEKSTPCMYLLFCRFQIDSSSILKNQGK